MRAGSAVHYQRLIILENSAPNVSPRKHMGNYHVIRRKRPDNVK